MALKTFGLPHQHEDEESSHNQARAKNIITKDKIFYPENKITVCRKCKYHHTPNGSEHTCLSSDAPFSDVVRGIRNCYQINTSGECNFFKE